ncbi:glycosyltransferase [Cryobacterium glaciale]|uniref:Glycosyltransferase n=1 Tax=Cryobacterium glaciale TaxID=1259145 RepID=A0A4R8V0V1_9MICO|nr:glycosyltransferase [Cryobacterium glaciale]TFB74348.1 glycosyltransferase [Cryobacterium glaciale]
MPDRYVLHAPPVHQRSDIFVSLVAVVDESTTDVGFFVRSLSDELALRYSNYEILLIDNGLVPSELQTVRTVLRELACIRVLRLSRLFSLDSAVFAGLESAIGDYLIVVTPGHDPISVIPDIIDLLAGTGTDIVQGISSVARRGTWSSRVGRRFFYWYNRKFLHVEIPSRATHLTGLTRRAVNTLTATSRSHRYLRHLIRHVGYGIADLHYEPICGAAAKRSVRSGYLQAVEMISSYSTHPLRVVTVMGSVAALFNLFYAIYVLTVSFFVGGVVQGWTTTSLQLSIMFFIISIVLAVQSEYLGRILTETRREPSYVIMEELESETLISDMQRRNVSV